MIRFINVDQCLERCTRRFAAHSMVISICATGSRVSCYESCICAIVLAHEIAYNSGHFVGRVSVACIADSFAEFLCITVNLKDSAGSTGSIPPALTSISLTGALDITTNAKESTIVRMCILLASLAHWRTSVSQYVHTIQQAWAVPILILVLDKPNRAYTELVALDFAVLDVYPCATTVLGHKNVKDSPARHSSWTPPTIQIDFYNKLAVIANDIYKT